MRSQPASRIATALLGSCVLVFAYPPDRAAATDAPWDDRDWAEEVGPEPIDAGETREVPDAQPEDGVDDDGFELPELDDADGTGDGDRDGNEADDAGDSESGGLDGEGSGDASPESDAGEPGLGSGVGRGAIEIEVRLIEREAIDHDCTIRVDGGAWQGFSDCGGRAIRFDDVAAGEPTIEVRSEGFDTEARTVGVPQGAPERIDLYPSAPASLSGVVRMPDGGAAANAEVRVFGAVDRTRGAYEFAETDPDGTWGFAELRSGYYDVEAISEGGRWESRLRMVEVLGATEVSLALEDGLSNEDTAETGSCSVAAGARPREEAVLFIAIAWACGFRRRRAGGGEGR